MTKMNNEKLTSPPRERVSVGITGIDRSTPDDMVEDGKCETLHNMRYEAGAWRPVHPYTLSKTIRNLPATMNVVYKHPAAPENIYIVESVANNLYAYYAYDITKIYYEAGALTTLISRSPERLKASHFGNILYLGDNTFIYSSEGYTLFSYDNTFPTIEYTNTVVPSAYLQPNLFSVDRRVYFSAPDISTGLSAYLDPDELTRISVLENVFNSDPSAKFRFFWVYKYEKTDDRERTDWSENPFPTLYKGAWCGEFAMFAVLRMNDGTYLNPSPVILNISQNDYSNVDEYLYGWLGNFRDMFAGANVVYGIKGSAIASKYISIDNSSHLPFYPVIPMTTAVKVTIPSNVDSSRIQSVALFATLPSAVIDYSALKAVGYDTTSGTPISKYFKQDSILDSPFYLVKEVDIDDMLEDKTNGKKYFEVTMAEETFNNMPNNLVYEPSLYEQIKGNVSLDYNSMQHVADIKASLNKEYLSDFLEENDLSERPMSIGVLMKREPFESITWSDSIYADYFRDKYQTCFSIHSPHASRFLFRDDTISGDIRSAKLKQAYGNNISYYTPKPTNDYRYPPIRIGKLPKVESLSHVDTLSAPNTLYVSAVNNPFSFPAGQSYNIGSSNNRILALQSAAIEMSDAKFGEMPLYAFTTEGIYALQAGAETLYSNIVPINYDRIINTNTLAINGAIVYITEKGMHLLTNQGSQVISTPINDKSNRPPLDFLRKCKMIYPKEHNEIILLDEDNTEGIAYVYNLDARYWSTRDLKGKKLNTDELYSTNILYDLANEDESKTLPAEIKTRPIKLGNVEFKRLETIIPRMSTHNHPALFTVEATGSVDGFNYMPLRSTDVTIPEARVNPLVLRRTPFSAKYFKFGFTFNPSEGKPLDLSISHVDIEWYRKLQHRMR